MSDKEAIDSEKARLIHQLKYIMDTGVYLMSVQQLEELSFKLRRFLDRPSASQILVQERILQQNMRNMIEEIVHPLELRIKKLEDI